MIDSNGLEFAGYDDTNMLFPGYSTPRENPVVGYKKQSESKSQSREAYTQDSARGLQTPQNDPKPRDFRFGVEDGLSDYWRGAAEEEKESLPFLRSLSFLNQQDALFSAQKSSSQRLLGTPKEEGDVASCNSDGFVSDTGYSLYGDAPYSTLHTQPSASSRSVSDVVKGINVREMASFLERTDSFIRRLEPAVDPLCKPSLEVTAKPVKTRQLNERQTPFTPVSGEKINDGRNRFGGKSDNVRSSLL